jgi:hypothetical protein
MPPNLSLGRLRSFGLGLSLAAIFVIPFGSVAAGEVSPTEACEFFLGQGLEDVVFSSAPAAASQRHWRHLASDPIEKGLAVPRYLEVAAKYLSQAVDSTGTGSFIGRVHLQGQISCLVDVVDKRVLTISILASTEVGETADFSLLFPEFDLAPGPRVKITAPTQRVIEVGNNIHGGKY